MGPAVAACSLEEAKAQVGKEGACLSGEEREITVLVHPQYTRDQVAGVRKELDALSRRYSKELGGVVVAYENLRLMSTRGWLFDTNPFIHLRVSARFIVFCPTAGDTLKAVVRKKSPHHLGCLAHGSFNISVPRPPKEPVEEWAGTLAAEGDTVTLSVLFTSLTSYLMPFIRASIHPDCAKELQERAETAAVAEGTSTSTLAEHDGTNLPNTRITFDDDSGISSNEADDNSKTKKRKAEEEEEEEEEEEDSRKSKKSKKKKTDSDCGEVSAVRKKKNKNTELTNSIGEEDGERNEVRGKKRKRDEEDDEGEYDNKKRKKKKKRASDSYLEAKTEGDREEDAVTENSSPSKKKDKKKSKEVDKDTEVGREEVSIEIGRNIEEGAKETINPLTKIKTEKLSSDEVEAKKKKKKKKQQQEEKDENEDEWMKIAKNIKKEKLEDNERRKEGIDKGSKEAKMAPEIEKERRQTGEEEAAAITANNTPTPTKKKKQKTRIKEEKMSSDEGRSTDNLPMPLFMIKREKTTPERRIKAKTKKEKG